MASLLRTRARPKASLLFPGYGDTTKERGKLDAFRLPPVEDCLDDVRRETGERQEPADVGVRHALLSGEVGDRLGVAGSFASAARRFHSARASAVRCLGMAGKARVGRGLAFGSRRLPGLPTRLLLPSASGCVPSSSTTVGYSLFLISRVRRKMFPFRGHPRGIDPPVHAVEAIEI